MTTLILEKVNHRFQRITNSRDASGLSVCIKLIKQSIKGIEHVVVDTTEHAISAISRFKPSKVIIQAIWCSEGDLKKMITLFPKTKFYIHIHSNIPFLASEGFSIHRIHEAINAGAQVIFNDIRATDIFKNSIYLPNIYTPKTVRVEKQGGDYINIICGGSIRLMKDHLSQAMASILYAERLGKKVRFYCNMSRSEGGDELKMNLLSLFRYKKGHEIVSIPWMSHLEFIKYCAGMDMGLQVSMSESFNIVAADYVSAGIPMVVSNEIGWADARCWASSGDPSGIADVMTFAHKYVERNRQSLLDHSNAAIEKWSDFVKA